MLSLITRAAPTGRPGTTRSARRTVAWIAAATALALAGAVLATVGSVSRTATGAGAPHIAPQVPVTATDLIHRLSNNSPEMAVDPTDPRFVVIANRLDAAFNCSLQVSGDGGRGWLTVVPVPKLPKGAATCYAPEVAFGSDGTLFYLFAGLGSGNSPMGAFLTTSRDRGRSFSTPRQVLGPERYQVRMALDQTEGSVGRIHLVWLEAGSPAPTGGLPATRNPIMSAYSDDGGASFSAPVQISDPDRTHAVAPALALGPNHSVDVAYYDLGDDVRDYMGLDGPAWTASPWSLVVTRSSDGGEHFTSGRVVDSDVVPSGRVMLIFTMPPASLAVDGSGRLYVAWDDARNGDRDVFLRRSTDSGQTWDKQVRLNDDPLHDGRDQYLPRLAVSHSGRIDAIFYDRRGDTDNIGTNVYYTSSNDHGATFSRNQRINDVTFSSIVGPRYTVPSARGLIEFGSRIALDSTDARVLAAWTDTGNTRAGVKAQDIAATEIDFAGASSPATALQWAGIALAASGIAGALIVVWLWARSGRAQRPPRARGRSPQ